MSVSESTPLYEAPPDVLCWRAHITTVVSIDLAEDKALIITASTDCCVRLWTICRAGGIISVSESLREKVVVLDLLHCACFGTLGDKALEAVLQSYAVSLLDLPRKTSSESA